MNTFLRDKDFGEAVEALIANELGYEHYVTNCDDEGVDLIGHNGEIIIDVKAYKAPRRVKSFKGIFLELYQKKSKRPGWLLDDTKKNNYYIFVVDCDEAGRRYGCHYTVERHRLRQLVEEYIKDKDAFITRYGMGLDFKDYETTHGYIIPYYLLQLLDIE